jgi:tetratricopeptide (TPR) repeat protein
MTEPVALKYRAFISYSHADASWAKWLHQGLEGFRVDKDLVGRETAAGKTPPTLRPIFRDRDDFTAGHTLTEQTLAALGASAALIVICSPASAKSHYVNEETKLYKARNPERPVIPLIVGGKPNDPELECFPPALKFKLDAEGRITDEPVEVVAADACEEGDGKNLALAKVVAGLLGVSSDDVFRRAERERRRKGRVRNGIVAVLVILVVAAGGSAVYAWQQLKTNEVFLTATLRTATEIVDEAVEQAEKYGVPRRATLTLLTKAEGLFDNMALLGRPTSELRYQKAWMLIQFARNYKILGDTVKQRGRAEEAHRLLAELTADRPDDPEKLRTLSVTLDERGDVLVAQGNFAEALKAYQDSLATRDRLAKADPDNIGSQRDLSVSYHKVGDALIPQGDLAGALKSYRDGLAIADRLAKADPDNAGWQRDLSFSYSKVGDVLLSQGNLAEALQSFQASLLIADHLAKTDPDNAGWQYDLGASNERIGVVLMAQSDLAGAQDYFNRRQVIISRLVKSDPTNAHWQRDLSVSYQEIGDVLMAKSDLVGALQSFQASLAIREHLSKDDPDNTLWQRDLSVSHGKVGTVSWLQGDLAGALQSFQASLAIRDRLARAQPDNVLWQYDLALSYRGVAMVLAKQDETLSALDLLRQGRVIIAQLTERFPDMSKDLAIFDARITELEEVDATGVGMMQPEPTAEGRR